MATVPPPPPLDDILLFERTFKKLGYIVLPGEMVEMVVTLRRVLRPQGVRFILGKARPDMSLFPQPELDAHIDRFLDEWKAELDANPLKKVPGVDEWPNES